MSTMKLLVALVLFTTSALADDLNPITMRLRCESMRVSAKPDSDADPVKWIDVAVDNFPGKPAEWIAVNHVRNSDQKVERLDQYNVTSMSKDQGYKHWVWTGVLKKSPDIMMKGELGQTKDGHWVYFETLSKKSDHNYTEAVAKGLCKPGGTE
jgi:hypothetical protein